jgi:hypothetical protein
MDTGRQVGGRTLHHEQASMTFCRPDDDQDVRVGCIDRRLDTPSEHPRSALLKRGHLTSVAGLESYDTAGHRTGGKFWQ